MPISLGLSVALGGDRDSLLPYCRIEKACRHFPMGKTPNIRFLGRWTNQPFEDGKEDQVLLDILPPLRFC